jgi:two-component system sensor histidine kinase BarA
MKGEVLIPHNRVRFNSEVLGQNRVAMDFVKDMGHEIRTPLNVIIGLCQYLERDHEAPLTSEQRDTVHRMERNAHALLQSVNRLLECVRTGNYK